MNKYQNRVAGGNVLISGGTGLVGKRLCSMLEREGFNPSVLSRSPGKTKGLKSYFWNPATGEIDPSALEGKDSIIHLAGAGIADKRWSSSRKKEIIDSRVQSTELLLSALKKNPNQIKTFIAASAVGIYGDRGDEWLYENSNPGKGFLAETTVQWEEATSKIKETGVRLVTLRIGVVLAKEGGALPEIGKSIKFNLGGILGSGEQYYPWIHIDDLCRMAIFAIKDHNVSGTFNAVAPKPVTNAELTKAVAVAMDKNALMLNAPAFVLKLALGEMATVVLNSARASSDKILKQGFKFQYEKVLDALVQIYKDRDR